MSGPVLVLGANGQVGHEMVRELIACHDVRAITRADCDLGDMDAVRALIGATKPAIIVNAAAYTAVDAAESDPSQAFLLNATLPGALAEEARTIGALLVHYSTDYVFDGTSETPYVETDPTCPINVYGASKWAGEEGIRASGADHLILRTSWVYGVRGRNFLRSILAAARTKPELTVVADQRGTPTWSRFLAVATTRMLARLASADGAPRASLLGTYHLSATGSATWHQFAEAIVAIGRERETLACERVVPITTADFGAPAGRPAMSVLSNDRVRMAFGVEVPGWEAQLRLAMAP